MKKIYNRFLFNFFNENPEKSSLLFFSKKFGLAILFFLFLNQSFLGAQGLIFSYSYENVTRNNGGGTLENGDIIEVHALVKVDKVADGVYFVDTIRSGTQFINGSLKIVTNEGLLFLGPYTDASGDDRGVYDVSNGIPRVRVNLGTGATNPQSGTANFGVTTGGGKITPGDKPKFYGTTLLMVAYRLKITANFGDTIHLTGNYYFDTSGVKRTYRFNYSAIKIIQNSGLCVNFSSASFTADSSFKSGNIQNRSLPAVAPGYIKINLGPNSPNDNYYAIANNTSADGTTDNTGPYKPTINNHRVFGGYWDIVGDHTGALDPQIGNAPVPPGTNGGYMLVVNAAYPTGEAYRETIKNVCPNTYYEFSAWIRNICGYCGLDQNSNPSYTPGVLPNLSFAVNDVDYYTTGDLPHENKWVKRGFLYRTGPTETQFTIAIKNNAAGGGGNDWVLDDIKLASCYPNLIMNPGDTLSACAGNPILITDTVKSYFNNYINFQWQASLDNGNSWISLPNTIGTRVPVLENGLWVYHVDTVFTPTVADSGRLIRLKVATTVPNLANANCAVDNSQSIFLKIYSSGCFILNTDLLDFYGTLLKNKASLKWTSQNDIGIKEYEIEKSTDGILFTSNGKVNSSGSENNNHYTFDDPESISDVVYYRLKMVNEELTNYKYSKIIVLYNKMSAFKVSAVNPFKNNLKIELFLPIDGGVEFILTDMYGNVVNRKMMQLNKGVSRIVLNNLNNLSSGLYILRTSYNGLIMQNKLIRAE